MKKASLVVFVGALFAFGVAGPLTDMHDEMPVFAWWYVVPILVFFLGFYIHWRWTEDILKPYYGKYRDAACIFLFMVLPTGLLALAQLLGAISLLGAWWLLLFFAIAYLGLFVFAILGGWNKLCRKDTTLSIIAREALSWLYCFYLFGAYGSAYSLWGLAGLTDTFLAVMVTSTVGGALIYVTVQTGMLRRFRDYIEMFAQWQTPAKYDRLKNAPPQR